MTDLLALFANALAATFLIPQIVRLLGKRDSAGVSATWAGFGVVTNAAWVFYLASHGMQVPLVAPALALLAYGLTLALVARLQRASRWIWHSAVYMIAIGLAALVGGLTTLGLFLALTPVIQVAPELAAVFRERHPSGLAPGTWALAAAEAVLWGLYGWLIADTALFGYGVVTTGASLVILGRWAWTRPQRRFVLRPGV